MTVPPYSLNSPNAETQQEGSDGRSGLRLRWVQPQTWSTQEARDWTLITFTSKFHHPA